METNSNDLKKGDSREYLANERTFMSWIRTGIAIMAFGFVVMKFSLFLSQLSLLSDKIVVAGKGHSSIIGLIILIIGAVIIPLSFLRYRKVNAQLNNGQFTSDQRLPLILTILLILVSIVLIIYLTSNII